MRTGAFLAVVACATACYAGSPARDFELIDAHVHVLEAPDWLPAELAEMNVRMLSIAWVDRHRRRPLDAATQHARLREVRLKTRGRVAWCSTWDPEGWEEPDYGARRSRTLEQSFANGAVAVKIWKNIGMDQRDADGRYLLPDNPALRPIFDTVENAGKTLFAHLAEPISAWQSLGEMTPNHVPYYRSWPVWHMFNKPGVPTRAQILEARERVLARHPRLRVVGCHLASLEEDVDQVATRLERYPNLAVDTAERVLDLMAQPTGKVRAFMRRYQDRVLYGTDGVLGRDRARFRQRQESYYARDWRYFTSTDEFEIETPSGKPLKVRGLGLPAEVGRKIFRENAIRWVPGILAATGR